MEEENQNDLPLEEELLSSPDISDEIEEDESLEENSTNEAVEEVAPKETKSETVDKDQKEKNRISQLKRDKYRALNRVKQLENEVNELRLRSTTSDEAAMAHYDSLIKLKLEQSRQKLKQAKSIGDEDAEVQATEELTEAKAEAQAMQSWRAQQKYNNQKNVTYQDENTYQDYQEPSIAENEDVSNWIESNPWFVNNSSHFDPDMAEEVVDFAKTLDRKFIRQGKQHKILSREYFEEIDDYVRSNFTDDLPFTNKKKEIVMKPINNPVSPVGRRTVAPQEQNVKDIKLSSAEKFMAKNAGISEEDWKKAIIETRKEEKFKSPNRGAYR